MRRMNRRSFGIAVSLLVLFVLWTIAICFIDVQAIGPKGTSVGFATFNSFFHSLTGVHMWLYTVTDWLGFVPLFFIIGFALTGFLQLIQRKSLLKVDRAILVLGGFYIIVMAIYLFFEIFVINYRPLLIDGCLEASYPSSTTVLVMCVMPTAIMQLNNYIENIRLKKLMSFILVIFTIFMIVARLMAGVHWVTDIIGGTLISVGLIMLYYTAISSIRELRFLDFDKAEVSEEKS